MIESIEITRLRGIREGKLDELSPLVVLVGPNGCGKSTVLDAILIGASENPKDGAQQAKNRHPGVKSGAKWLTWLGGKEGQGKLNIGFRLSVDSPTEIRLVVPGPHGWQEVSIDKPLRLMTGQVGLHGRQKISQDYLPALKIIEKPEGVGQSPLHVLLSRCIEKGQRAEVREILKTVIPEAKDLVILTDGDQPIVHVEYDDHSVPAALAGDGIHSLLRICLELVGCSDGVVLFEEPEVHQHPAAIRQTVRAILAATRRNIQVILTTHSLELIDSMLFEATEEDIERMSLYRLDLKAGQLESHRMSGHEIAAQRTEIESDLR